MENGNQRETWAQAQRRRRLASAKHFQVDISQRFFKVWDPWEIRQLDRVQRNIFKLQQISVEIGGVFIAQRGKRRKNSNTYII